MLSQSHRLTRPGPSGERGREEEGLGFLVSLGSSFLSSPLPCFIGASTFIVSFFVVSSSSTTSTYTIFFPFSVLLFLFYFINWTVKYLQMFLQTYPLLSRNNLHVCIRKKENKSKLKTFQTQKAFFVNLCGN